MNDPALLESLQPIWDGVPVDEIRLAATRALCERSLYDYFRLAWPSFDPAPFVGGWHLEAIAEHLEAVARGEIRKLLINIRPRSSKTNLVSVAFPTWIWSLQPDPAFPLIGPGVRFLCASYGANKAQGDGVTARRLIGSRWYQELIEGRWSIAKDRDNQEQYDNDAGGSRISTGIPESLGKGGLIRIIDDPHKTDEVESETVRQSVLRAYQEVWSTRGNDPAVGAEIMIMQRQAVNDLSGYWLDQYGQEVVHLCIPAYYEERRHCVTRIGGDVFWEDPRSVVGESFWPERFPGGEDEADREETRLGPYAYAGQIQQRPNPRGGGVIQDHWWQHWPPEGEEETWLSEVEINGQTVLRPRFPPFDLVVVSADGAYTQDEENDYCAASAWGMFEYRSRPGIMLIEAWHERLELRQFVERILVTCRKKGREADRLLIENKASGRSAAQEVRRLMRDEEFSIETIEPKGDKIARMLAVQPLFSGGVIWVPWREPAGYTWANTLIEEVSMLGRGAHDDLADTASQALNWLRRQGLARLPSEHEAEVIEGMMFQGSRPTIAQAYGVG